MLRAGEESSMCAVATRERSWRGQLHPFASKACSPTIQGHSGNDSTFAACSISINSAFSSERELEREALKLLQPWRLEIESSFDICGFAGDHTATSPMARQAVAGPGLCTFVKGVKSQ
jgi:hypothetical protein